MVRKAAKALGAAPGTERFERMVKPGARFGTETGNTNSASLFLALASCLEQAPLLASGERILMFAYGSGLSAEMFELEAGAYTRPPSQVDLRSFGH
jgi:3-hydroxy-3-methylglutaryl CoA synthase